MTSLDLSPAERRRAKVRGSILEAAERVFADAGEDGLSIRRLAEEIDYSPAAIYKYFGSKEELIDELKEAFFERILIRIDDVHARNLPYADRARLSVETYIRTALEKPHHYAAAFSTLQPTVLDDPACAPAYTWEEFTSSNKGRAFSYLVELVKEGQTLGHVDASVDTFRAAKSIWACSHGLAQLMTHMPQFPSTEPDGRYETADVMIAYHADFVMRGLESIQHAPECVNDTKDKMGGSDV